MNQEEKNFQNQKKEWDTDLRDNRQKEEAKQEEKNRKKQFFNGMISGVLLVFILGGLFLAGQQIYQLYDRYKNGQNSAAFVVSRETEQKMDVIEQVISENFLNDIDYGQMREGIYRGMVESLGDPYSTYYSEEELKQTQQKTEGIYYGIGARVSMDADTGLARVSSVISGSPAEEAGLKEGDLFYKVEDTLVQGMELSEIVNLVKGEEGTTVHLTMIREGETDYLEFDVQRRKMENETVVSRMLDEKIGYIRIAEFDEVTVDQFADALAVCNGSGMQGLVLDLRGNPGGNLTAVCEIARMMLPEGLIVYTEDKYGERTEYTCDGSRELKIPLAVLVDSNSASASEILAGAIKDYGIGTLVGTTTFGKGIVQRILTLSDGSAVKLTVSNYYTPNGNNIHEKGISPDVEVEFDGEAYLEDGTDNQLEEATRIVQEKLGETE